MMSKRAGLILFLSLLSALIGSFLGLGFFLSKDIELSERHYPSGKEFSFDFNSYQKDNSFQQYIESAQVHLRASKVGRVSDEVIKNASPFMLEPASNCPQSINGKHQKGIVLTHGLIASPYSMIDIGEYFQSRCFFVLAPILPGHVSRPGDFQSAGWEDWAQVQHYATQALAEKVEQVFLSGHSVGGVLALYEALNNELVEGLILFTPALQITEAAKYAQYITPLDVLFSKAAWFEIRDDESDYRYESLTFSAAAESYALNQAVIDRLPDSGLTIPIFSVASVEDNTVDTNAILDFMASQQHPLSSTLLYTQHPLAEREKVTQYLSYAPKQAVLSVSHLGIMLPASHAEYGREGAYRNCGHYYNQQNGNWGECKAGRRDFYGEVTFENRQQGLIERIAFNPFYDDLLIKLDRFLSAVE